MHAGPELDPIEKLDEGLLYAVDMKRIERTITYNGFDPRDHWDLLSNTGTGQSSQYIGAGLWILPSYFNHLCVDKNVERLMLGDLMFIRSIRPILKGEELILLL